MNRRDFLKLTALAAATSPLASCLGGNVHPRQDRPNIVIIMADDMGFSDIGCYGGEIHTPNLDKLAADGLRFTQFYNTARCCPTRASLLTGLYPHQAGVGHMNEQFGPKLPGYQGYLTDRCLTIAEVLNPAGYFTATTGKWHVGAAKKEWWPLQRGFDRFYGVPEGGGFYYKPRAGRPVVLDNETLYTSESEMPEDWYSTDAWTDYAIQFIKEARSLDKPFFIYLAHNAPHWPLQCKSRKDMEKYRDVYKNGWDEIREKRYKRQLEAGLIDKSWPLSPPDRNGKKWDELTSEQKAVELEGMTAYAAVVERMDTQIGRVVETLKQQNVLDNTLLLFLSDNGGCAEGGDFISNEKPKTPIGAAESFVCYGKFWANVSNTPYRRYKHHIEQGGIATPLIAHWPDQINGSRTNTFCRHMGHVIDLMATCADLAGAEYPETFKNKPIVPLQGKSLRPLLLGDDRPIHETLYWEHERHCAIRIGNWKLVGDIGKNNWQLFDLEHDGTELNDVAAQYPEKVSVMAANWQEWAERSYVLPHYTDRKTL